MPDPKLKPIIAEIEAVLKKHDFAAVIMLQSETHVEYLLHISPSWSCCAFEENAGRRLLRFKAARADYPSKEAHCKAVASSIGMIMAFIDCGKALIDKLQQVAEQIGETIDFEHITAEEGELPPPPRNPGLS